MHFEERPRRTLLLIIEQRLRCELTFKVKTAMSKEQPIGNQHCNDGLIFMLSQLRDDLAELLEWLEGKSLSYEVAMEGAKAQLSWVLKELSES